MESLGYMADVIFVSKEFSNFMGETTPEEMVKKFRTHIRGDAMLICPWGEKGAFASDNENVYSRYEIGILLLQNDKLAKNNLQLGCMGSAPKYQNILNPQF